MHATTANDKHQQIPAMVTPLAAYAPMMTTQQQQQHSAAGNSAAVGSSHTQQTETRDYKHASHIQKITQGQVLYTLKLELRQVGSLATWIIL